MLTASNRSCFSAGRCCSIRLGDLLLLLMHIPTIEMILTRPCRRLHAKPKHQCVPWGKLQEGLDAGIRHIGRTSNAESTGLLYSLYYRGACPRQCLHLKHSHKAESDTVLPVPALAALAAAIPPSTNGIHRYHTPHTPDLTENEPSLLPLLPPLQFPPHPPHPPHRHSTSAQLGASPQQCPHTICHWDPAPGHAWVLRSPCKYRAGTQHPS